MWKLGRRPRVAFAVVVATAGLAAQTAHADTTVIGRLNLSGGLPTFSNQCGPLQCTVVQIASDAAQTFVAASPVDGTITSWSFRTPVGGPIGTQYSLRVVRGTYVGVNAGNPFTLPNANDAVRGPFPASIAVKRGDLIGLRAVYNGSNADNIPMFSGAPANMYGVFYSPDLDNNGSPRALTAGPNPGQQLAVQATIQFATPPPGCPPNCPPPVPQPQPKPKPSVIRFSVSPTTFAAASRGPSVQAARKRRPPVGTKVSYTLSAAATTRFTVERATTGRRVRGTCVAPKRGNRTKPKCTRYVRLRGSFTNVGVAGANRLRFTGRLRGRKLPPGRYRLTGVASNANGSSRAVTARFQIVS